MGAAEYMRRPIAPGRWRNLEKNSALLFIFKSIGCRFTVSATAFARLKIENPNSFQLVIC